MGNCQRRAAAADHQSDRQSDQEEEEEGFVFGGQEDTSSLEGKQGTSSLEGKAGKEDLEGKEGKEGKQGKGTGKEPFSPMTPDVAPPVPNWGDSMQRAAHLYTLAGRKTYSSHLSDESGEMQ